MSAAKQILRPLVSVTLLAITVLGLINVYGDNTEVTIQAKQVACGGQECPTQVTRLERNPLAQTFDIAAEPKGSRKGSVTATVQCRRVHVLIGEWECLAQK